MVIALVPIEVIFSRIDFLEPSPIATIVITAATPITIPHTERNVRIRFRNRALKAMRKSEKALKSIPPNEPFQ